MPCSCFCGRQNPEGAALLAQTRPESRSNIRGSVERPFSRVHGGLRFEIGIGTMTVVEEPASQGQQMSLALVYLALMSISLA